MRKPSDDTLPVTPTLTPAVEGQWYWYEDHSLRFVPAKPWPVERKISVGLPAHGPWGPGGPTMCPKCEVRTPKPSAAAGQGRCGPDPLRPGELRCRVHVEFSHPVAYEELRSAVAVELSEGVRYRSDRSEEQVVTIKLAQHGRSAEIITAPLRVPENPSVVRMMVKDGMRVASSGSTLGNMAWVDAELPGRDDLAVDIVGVERVDEDDDSERHLLEVRTNHPTYPKALQKHLSVSLATAMRGGSEGSRWTPLTVTTAPNPTDPQRHLFEFRAPPASEVRVHVNADVRSALGFRLSKQVSATYKITPLVPRCELSGRGALLPLRQDKRLALRVEGFNSAQAVVSRVLPHQLNQLVRRSGGDLSASSLSSFVIDSIAEHYPAPVSLQPPDNVGRRLGSVDLATAGAGQSRGVFIITLTCHNATGQPVDARYKGDGSEQDRRIVLITDLGLIVKRSRANTIDVFVQSLTSGAAIPGAVVTVVGTNGRPVREGLTDRRGHLRLTAPYGDLADRHPLLIKVTHGQDETFIPLSAGTPSEDLSRFDVHGVEGGDSEDRLMAAPFTDRGLYRPGEMVHLGVVIRRANGTALNKRVPLLIQVFDPEAELVREVKVTAGRGGLASVDVAMQHSAAAGRYTAKIKLPSSKAGDDSGLLGSVSWRTQDFETEKMKVHARFIGARRDGPKPAWLLPSEAKVNVSARHLFGAPAQGRKASVKLFIEPGPARFASLKGFRFGDVGAAPQVTELELTARALGAAGDTTFPLSRGSLGGLVHRVRAVTKVHEAGGGRVSTAAAATLVSDRQWLLGVSAPGCARSLRVGERCSVAAIAVDRALRRVEVEGLRVRLFDMARTRVLVTRPNGRYALEETPARRLLSESSLSVGLKPTPLPLNTTLPGEFRLEVTNAEGASLAALQYSVMARHSRELDEGKPDGAVNLSVQLDKPSYNAGETITVQVKSPSAGAGLVTIERDHVLSFQRFRAKAGINLVTLETPRALVGNGYVHVQVLRDINGPSLYTSPSLTAVRSFRVSRAPLTMKLAMSAPGRVEPGKPLSIKLHAERPAKALVFAVDEGILLASRYQNPDPLGTILAKRALEVSTYHMLNLLLPSLAQIEPVVRAGGGAEGLMARHLNPFRRKRKAPVAFWAGVVDVGPEGATLKYTPPADFHGKLRAVAVATNDSQIGTASSYTEVRGPLMVSGDVPRFAMPGDEGQATFSVFNDRDESVEVTLSTLREGGLKPRIVGPRKRRIPPKSESVVKVLFDVGKGLGHASLGLRAALTQAPTDGGPRTASNSESLTVQPWQDRELSVQAGVLKGGVATVALARELRPEFRKVTFRVSASPSGWTEPLERYLDDYEHLCSEQLLSKAMPALVMSTRNQGAVPPEVAKRLNEAFSMLSARQAADGGIGLWQAGRSVYPEVNLYALQFLLEARDAGLHVPPGLLRGSLNYATSFATAQTDDVPLKMRAWSNLLLVRGERAPGDRLAALHADLKKHAPKTWRRSTAALQLAAAYRAVKEEQACSQLISELPIEDPKWWRPGRVGEPWSGGLAETGERLHLIAHFFPDALSRVPSEVLNAVAEKVSSGWLSSFSAAMLVRAFHAMERHGPAASEVGLEFLDAEGRAVTVERAPAAETVTLPASVRSVRVRNPTTSPLFYALSEQGYDASPDPRAQRHGLTVTRQLTTLRGHEVKRVEVGDEFALRVQVTVPAQNEPLKQGVVRVLLPGGTAAVASPVTLQRGDRAARGVASLPLLRGVETLNPTFVDAREDRVLLYVNHLNPGTFSYDLRLRAIATGRYTSPPTVAQAMYDPRVFARDQPHTLHIEDAQGRP